jgi:L-xylulokinase
MVRVADRFEPDQERHAFYTQKYRRFRDTTTALGALSAAR